MFVDNSENIIISTVVKILLHVDTNITLLIVFIFNKLKYFKDVIELNCFILF